MVSRVHGWRLSTMASIGLSRRVVLQVVPCRVTSVDEDGLPMGALTSYEGQSTQVEAASLA